MTDINNLIIIGRLTKDVDFGYTQSGVARMNLSIATNRSVKQNGTWSDKASFFDVRVWGKTAENLKQYLGKGKQIAVSGFLEQDRWEKDGQKFSKVYIVASSIQLLGGKSENQNQSTNQQAENSQNNQQTDFNPKLEDESFLEDIPF